jgi:hypothetical protein
VASGYPRLCQLVPGNEQIVRPLDPKHLHPDQYRRDDVIACTPFTPMLSTRCSQGNASPCSSDEARIRAHLRDRPA